MILSTSSFRVDLRRLLAASRRRHSLSRPNTHVVSRQQGATVRPDGRVKRYEGTITTVLALVPSRRNMRLYPSGLWQTQANMTLPQRHRSVARNDTARVARLDKVEAGATRNHAGLSRDKRVCQQQLRGE